MPLNSGYLCLQHQEVVIIPHLFYCLVATVKRLFTINTRSLVMKPIRDTLFPQSSMKCGIHVFHILCICIIIIIYINYCFQASPNPWLNKIILATQHLKRKTKYTQNYLQNSPCLKVWPLHNIATVTQIEEILSQVSVTGLM